VAITRGPLPPMLWDRILWDESSTAASASMWVRPGRHRPELLAHLQGWKPCRRYNATVRRAGVLLGVESAATPEEHARPCLPAWRRCRRLIPSTHARSPATWGGVWVPLARRRSGRRADGGL